MPEAEARALLTERLSPRYRGSPLLIKRLVRATPVWRLVAPRAWRALRSLRQKIRL
jgi:hypothetical protein